MTQTASALGAWTPPRGPRTPNEIRRARAAGAVSVLVGQETNPYARDGEQDACFQAWLDGRRSVLPAPARAAVRPSATTTPKSQPEAPPAPEPVHIDPWADVPWWAWA